MASSGQKVAMDPTAEVKEGAFVRSPSTFRNWIRADPHADFPAETGRYVLYVSYACPWANRCLAVRAIKGLEHVIDVAVVSPVWDYTKPGVDEHRGWLFRGPTADDPASTHDPVFGAKTLRELYEAAEGQSVAKFTVPVLLDRKTRRIVNNESSEIIRMFNSEFKALARHPEIDLCPREHLAEIDKLNDEIYDAINNGVYKCGFATAQAPYEAACKQLFDMLDRLEDHLSRQRFLVGRALTEADIRLFMTLVRFDAVYFVHFKTSKKLIREYKHLHGYVRDIFQQPGVAGTVNMYHIKHHYYGSHNKLNPYGIVPITADEDLGAPHGRAAL